VDGPAKANDDLSKNERTPERPIYLIAGHTTRDFVDSAWRLGGSVVYSSIAARRMNLTTRIVTAHGVDLATDAIFSDLEHITLGSASTTTFRNREEGGSRIQFLLERGDPMSPDLVTVDWRKPNILHLAPVFQEIDTAFVSSFKPDLRCATLQGWMRGVAANRQIVAERSPLWHDLLEMIDIAVFSREDLRHHLKWRESIRNRVHVSVETLGAAGCIVVEAGAEHHVEARPIEVSDTTGAGDIFAAAFFAEYYRTGNAVIAGRVANRFTGELLMTERFREILTAGGTPPQYP